MQEVDSKQTDLTNTVKKKKKNPNPRDLQLLLLNCRTAARTTSVAHRTTNTRPKNQLEKRAVSKRKPMSEATRRGENRSAPFPSTPYLIWT